MSAVQTGHAECLANLERFADISSVSIGSQPWHPSRNADGVLTGNLAALQIPAIPGSANRLTSGLEQLSALSASDLQLRRLLSGLSVPGGPWSGLASQIARLRSRFALPGAANVQGLPPFQFLAAVRALSAQRVDILAPNGGVALRNLIGRMRADGSLDRMRDFRVPQAAALNLGCYARLGDAVRLAGTPGAANIRLDLGQSRLASLISQITGGPLAWLCSPGGTNLLPSVVELRTMGDGLAALRLRNEWRQFLSGLGRGVTGDPLDAFERSGCCAALREFSELKACSQGARRIAALERDVRTVRNDLGVDLRRAGSAVELRQMAGRVNKASGESERQEMPLISDPRLPQAMSLASLLGEARRLSAFG